MTVACCRPLSIHSSVLPSDSPKGCDPGTGGGPPQPFTFTSDLALLEKAIEETDECRLVVVDPVLSYVGATDANLDVTVRLIMTPLAELAARTNVAILLIMHLNKKTAEEAVYRVGGSMAWLAQAPSPRRNFPTSSGALGAKRLSSPGL
jgi:hypothetical protein